MRGNVCKCSSTSMKNGNPVLSTCLMAWAGCIMVVSRIVKFYAHNGERWTGILVVLV